MCPGAAQSPNQIDARNDVAPLIAAAHLQSAAIGVEEYEKVVSLQEWITEFGERDSFFGLQTPADGFFADEIVYGKEFSNVAQKFHHRDRAEPIEIVDDARRIRLRVEIQKAS